MAFSFLIALLACTLWLGHFLHVKRCGGARAHRGGREAPRAGAAARGPLSVTFVDAHGGEEAGIDMGGLTKELLEGVVAGERARFLPPTPPTAAADCRAVPLLAHSPADSFARVGAPGARHSHPHARTTSPPPPTHPPPSA